MQKREGSGRNSIAIFLMFMFLPMLGKSGGPRTPTSDSKSLYMSHSAPISSLFKDSTREMARELSRAHLSTRLDDSVHFLKDAQHVRCSFPPPQV